MINLWPNSLGQPDALVEVNDPDSRFTNKAQRCHAKVRAKGSGNEYAICTSSLGYEQSYRKRHRTREAGVPQIVEAGSNRIFESVADLVKRYGIEHREHPPHQLNRTPRPSSDELRRMPKSIGYSPRHAKWYGWSHRAVAGFGVGSTVKKGDVLCKGVDEYGIKGGPYDEGYAARTLADAKAMAASFAQQVA